MRKFTSLAIFALMWLVGTAAFADDHGYVNGICTMHDDCDEHFEAPKQDADGFYLLYNAGNVEWISDLVANGVIDPNCKLMTVLLARTTARSTTARSTVRASASRT